MNTSPTALDPHAAYTAMTEHRHYAYRGCAPHWDPALPGRALGDDTLTVDAWSDSTEDGGLPQKTRIDLEKRAKAVCRACPVLAACRAYASSYTELPDGTVHLAEPAGIWGGIRALDRHRALIAHHTTTAAAAGARPTAAQLAEAGTPQKRAVLAALARTADEENVARLAGMDVRTANWHRSAVCALLGLDKETATRAELLAAAAEYGLLPAGIRIAPDARPVAAVPTTGGVRQRWIAAGQPQQLALDLPLEAAA